MRRLAPVALTLVLLPLKTGSRGEVCAQVPGEPALSGFCRDALQRGDIPLALFAQCLDASIALELLQPELGIAVAGGNPVLGTASPIGTRFRGIPRLYIGARLNFAFPEVPDVVAYAGSDPRPGAASDFVLPAARLDLSVGLFEGVNPAATLSGFGAVEVLGSLGVLILPSGQGFRSNSTTLGLGLRVGLLRESFTAPGISVTGAYRWTGDLDYGSAPAGDDSELGLDLGVWAVRAGISKSFSVFGLTLNGGYDAYRSDVHLSLVDPESGELRPVIERSRPADLDAGRWSASLDIAYLVLYFAAVVELGWQEGQTRPTWHGHEVESGKFFTGLGLRISL